MRGPTSTVWACLTVFSRKAGDATWREILVENASFRNVALLGLFWFNV
jgi:hypothetical protein